MRAHVDKDLCIGCGLCESICPKVFKMDDDGKAEALEVELDASAVGEAKEAQSQCPVEAISIDD